MCKMSSTRLSCPKRRPRRLLPGRSSFPRMSFRSQSRKNSVSLATITTYRHRRVSKKLNSHGSSTSDWSPSVPRSSFSATSNHPSARKAECLLVYLLVSLIKMYAAKKTTNAKIKSTNIQMVVDQLRRFSPPTLPTAFLKRLQLVEMVT